MSGLRPSPPRALRGYAPLVVLLAAFAAFTSMVPTTGKEEVRSEQVAGGPVTAPGAAGSTGTVATTPGGAPVGGATGGAPAAGAGTGGATAARGATGCPDRALQVPGDTYSPPCVAWSGDNGGATSRGVTGDTIKVAWRLTSDTATAGAVQAAVGSGVDITDTPGDIRRTIAGLQDYFNSHYQLYGRKLSVDVFDGRGSGADELVGGGQDGANADAVTVADVKKAFVDASVGTAPYADALARRQVIATGFGYSSDEWYAERDPYVWGDVSCSQSLRQMADYMNQRIFGGTADHAGGDLRGRPRKIAIISPENSFYQDCVKAFLAAVRAKGNSITENLTYALDINTVSQDTSAIVAKLAADGITSVVCFTDPVSPLFYTAKATQQRYFPEWLTVGTAATDSDIAGQQYDQQQWVHAFGLRTLTENTARQASVAYAAFKTARPNEEPAGLALFGIYSRLLQVVLAIQGAGPDLTPQTFGRGFQSYPGGTGLFGQWVGRPGDHTLQVDAQEVYWDPAKTSTYNGLPGAYVPVSPRHQIGQWPVGKPPVP